MNIDDIKHDILWIAGEICYYLGLVLAVLLLPALALLLWLMDLVDKADPNYWYVFIAWVLSALMFLAGVRLKNWIYSSNKDEKDTGSEGNIS